LFGYEKGAFTGADKQTKGVFEDAHKGTIFLDEIGDISPRMQVTLLRALEERQISRVGSTKNISVDVRVIVASNKDLWELCKEGKFRYDLYYRLAIAELRLPSFMEFDRKERKEWITYFLETMYTKLEKRYLNNISKDVWEFLLNYRFYGNLRELRNTVETFYTFCDTKITIDDIPQRMLKMDPKRSLKLDDIIKAHINKVVTFCDGNISRAAVVLDKNRATVRKYLD
jgi:transcriptional regulator with PAS, ATPase and Fis domain